MRDFFDNHKLLFVFLVLICIGFCIGGLFLAYRYLPPDVLLFVMGAVIFILVVVVAGVERLPKETIDAINLNNKVWREQYNDMVAKGEIGNSGNSNAVIEDLLRRINELENRQGSEVKQKDDRIEQGYDSNTDCEGLWKVIELIGEFGEKFGKDSENIENLRIFWYSISRLGKDHYRLQDTIRYLSQAVR